MAFIGLFLKGNFVFLTIVYAFVIIPLLELIFPVDTTNLSEEVTDYKLKKNLFDWLLYLNLPVVYGLVFFGIYEVSYKAVETYELIGMIVSVGIVFRC